MGERFTIVGLGEALFDVYPDRQVLGGAPLNMAVHAHQLGAAHGGRGVVVTRVGQDDLGQMVIDELSRRGMTTEYIQTDPDRDTGKVYVGRDARGEPTYEVARNVAWDWLSYDPGDETLAQRCEAVCFGSLAQREGQARTAVQRFLDAATRAVRMFDVNLRQKDCDPRVLRRSCELSTVVKVNAAELAAVTKALGMALAGDGAGSDDQRAQALLSKFKLKMVVVTRGASGTEIYTPTGKVTGKPASYPAASGADAVGAGDACAAAVLVGLLMRWPLEKVVELANHAGAYVASQPGATPVLPPGVLAMAR